MKKIFPAIVQLKNGDAVTGLVDKLGWWNRYLRVRPVAGKKVVFFDHAANESTPGDGEAVVPKSSVNFLQKLPGLPTEEN